MKVAIAAGLIVFAMSLMAGTPAWAQPKTDVVTLRNGDRFTGEIKSLSLGRLELSTDDAGTIYIEWDKVATIASSGQFEVAAVDGSRYLGSLVGTTPGTVIVTGEDGKILVSLPRYEVINIMPIGRSLWKRMDGAIDVGFSYTKSSDIGQASFNGHSTYRRPAFEVRLDGSATLTIRSDDEEDTDDRAALNLSYVRFRGRRAFISGAGRLESNRSLGLELRSQLGVMVGLRFVKTEGTELELGGGVVVNQERGVDTEPTQNLEGMLGAKFVYYSYDHPRTNVDTRLQYYPSFSEWKRQRVQSDIAVKRELFRDFFASLNVFYTFDSNPPNANARRTDYGISASLGWSY
jgi:hypothetical protein